MVPVRSLICIGVVLYIRISPQVSSLQAFDCNSTPLQYVSYSLADLPSCENLPKPEPSPPVTISLYTAPEYVPIHVYKCKAFIKRRMFYCRFPSGATPVSGGNIDFYKEITKAECLSWHIIGDMSSLKMYGIEGPVINGSFVKHKVPTGTETTDGWCNGGQFNTTDQSYDKVMVETTVELEMFDYFARYDLHTGKVHMADGTACEPDRLLCKDQSYSTVAWKDNVNYECGKKSLIHVTTGIGHLIYSTNRSTSGLPTKYYAVEKDGHEVVVPVTGNINICSQTFMRSSISGLFISTTYHNPDLTTGVQDPIKMIIDQVESKMSNIILTTDMSLERLSDQMITNDCLLERQEISSLIMLGYAEPKSFAYALMKEKGYTAIRAGEVIYLAKCPAVEVKIRSTADCFEHIPVEYKGRSVFTETRSMVITESSPQVPCSRLLTSMVRTKEGWFAVGQSEGKREPPLPIHLGLDGSKYNHTMLSIIPSDLYSSSELEMASKRILYPYQLESASSNVGYQVLYGKAAYPNLDSENLIPKSSIKSYIDAAMWDIWGWAKSVGSICTSIIGLVVIVRVFMFFINCVMNLLILYDAFGLSWRLLASFIDGLTSYFMHKSYKVLTDAGVITSSDKPDIGDQLQSHMERAKEDAKAYTPVHMLPYGHSDKPVYPQFVRQVSVSMK